MTATAFDPALFRTQFDAYACTQTYPDTLLSRFWIMGSAFISPNNGNSRVLTQAQAQLCNDLMCAHLLKSRDMLNSGQVTAPVTGATEGTVSMQLMPPPAKSAFGYWLATTPYGAELRALLGVIAGVGFYVGGLPEKSALRRVGGYFG